MIETITTNTLGTVSIIAKFGKMKKVQDFVTYPIQKDSDVSKLPIQSHHRFGYIYNDGTVKMSPNRAQYANSLFYMMSEVNGSIETDHLSQDELERISNAVHLTASPMAGGNNCLSVYCDNSNADKF